MTTATMSRPRIDGQGETFEDFYQGLIARHQHPATHLLSSAGAVITLGAIVAGLSTRKAKVGLAGAAVGQTLSVAAHLFQPGTLAEEVRAVNRHPVWALRAESRRLRSLSPIRL